VLCLQEVDRGQSRSGHAHQTELVASAMGAPAWRFEPAIIGEPGAAWRPATDDGDDAEQGAGYGVALISRRPVSRWHVIHLAPAPIRSVVYVPTQRRVILLPDEPRVAVAAEIDTPAGPIVVTSSHLSFVPGWNIWQLRLLTRRLAELVLPCVLLGDLNLPGPVVRLTARSWRPLALAKTFPAQAPKLQIDHALGLGDLPAVRRVFAELLPLSDHRALVVDLGE
jgi:endonuclease/exonuclease/phosphatase family metal-dependent hydrolase